MEKIRQLDDKIVYLKQLKEQAETKMARALLKKVKMILGKDLDLNLVTLLLEEIWNTTSEENKEVWRHKAATFRNNRITKVAKAI
jgi:hypothetical protein